MLLFGSPSHVYHCLSSLRTGAHPTADYVFRPDTVSRLAVRPVRNPQTLDICVSTEIMTLIEDSSLWEIGRIGLLAHDHDDTSGAIVLLSIHDPHIKDPIIHGHMADVALSILRDQTTDMTLVPLAEMMEGGPGRLPARVSAYISLDSGVSWTTKDVGDLMNDFLIGDDGYVTVRRGQRVDRLRATVLLDAILREQPLPDLIGHVVPEDVILVHFVPPGQSKGALAYFDLFSRDTVVIGEDGVSVPYECDYRCLVLNCRAPEMSHFAYIGIVQSGNRFIGAPLVSDEVRRLGA